ncbi:MAG: phosphate signaling complex protein PhoU [Actinomycetes bacterium]
MRAQYHEELDYLGELLVEMTHLAGSALNRATTALLDADLTLAESVIASDELLNMRSRELGDRAVELLARQQPVASDLRTIIAALTMNDHLERMGDLAAHVAKTARLRYPESAAYPEVRELILRMGQVAQRIVEKVGTTIATRDVHAAAEVRHDDDEMDQLHRRLFAVMLDPGWPHGVEAAIDVTLLSRFFERYADHAVSVAQQVIFVVTGEMVVNPGGRH